MVWWWPGKGVSIHGFSSILLEYSSLRYERVKNLQVQCNIIHWNCCKPGQKKITCPVLMMWCVNLPNLLSDDGYVFINPMWFCDVIYYQRTWSTLVQVMASTSAWCLMAPSHYLNQCWQDVLWHSPDGNSIEQAQNISIMRAVLKIAYSKLQHLLKAYDFKLKIFAATDEPLTAEKICFSETGPG